MLATRVAWAQADGARVDRAHGHGRDWMRARGTQIELDACPHRPHEVMWGVQGDASRCTDGTRGALSAWGCASLVRLHGGLLAYLGCRARRLGNLAGLPSPFSCGPTFMVFFLIFCVT